MIDEDGWMEKRIYWYISRGVIGAPTTKAGYRKTTLSPFLRNNWCQELDSELKLELMGNDKRNLTFE